MVAKRTRTFIDNFLIEDKSKETLEVKNPKECWEWYNKAMDELQELERLAKIGKEKEKGVEIIWDDEDMYCGNCDNYVYDDENYCKECGVKLLIHGRDVP